LVAVGILGYLDQWLAINRGCALHAALEQKLSFKTITVVVRNGHCDHCFGTNYSMTSSARPPSMAKTEMDRSPAGDSSGTNQI
jgi:hypothetical protein